MGPGAGTERRVKLARRRGIWEPEDINTAVLSPGFTQPEGNSRRIAWRIFREIWFVIQRGIFEALIPERRYCDADLIARECPVFWSVMQEYAPVVPTAHGDAASVESLGALVETNLAWLKVDCRVGTSGVLDFQRERCIEVRIDMQDRRNNVATGTASHGARRALVTFPARQDGL